MVERQGLAIRATKVEAIAQAYRGALLRRWGPLTVRTIRKEAPSG